MFQNGQTDVVVKLIGFYFKFVRYPKNHAQFAFKRPIQRSDLLIFASRLTKLKKKKKH